jgi:hypothetical protein
VIANPKFSQSLKLMTIHLTATKINTPTTQSPSNQIKVETRETQEALKTPLVSNQQRNHLKPALKNSALLSPQQVTLRKLDLMILVTLESLSQRLQIKVTDFQDSTDSLDSQDSALEQQTKLLSKLQMVKSNVLCNP